MLAILKSGRNLEALRYPFETWEAAFSSFMLHTDQCNKDVIAECQYYYESKSVIANRDLDEESRDRNENEDKNKYDGEGDHDVEDDIDSPVVSFICFSD